MFFSIPYTMNLSTILGSAPTIHHLPVVDEVQMVASDNLSKYLSEAVLPPMIHGSSAPPVIPGKHKAHANHLQIQPEKHRKWFTTIIPSKPANMYPDEAKAYCTESLPRSPLHQPNTDINTGYAFTVPANPFGISTPVLPRPTNVDEIVPWVIALPLQTVARTLHTARPGVATKWDFTALNHADPDSRLWQTLVWREAPAASTLETFYRRPVDPLRNCRVAFIVQPPWVLSKGDIYSFMRCKAPLSAHPRADGDNPPPMSSAQRLWAKLWDTCVRLKCHRWVITTYDTWTFGAFTQGFSTGQVYNTMDYNASSPTVLECLTYHVASSISLAEGLLPTAMETNSQSVLFDIALPPPRGYPAMSFPDSDSEWEGCDEEPGLCAEPLLDSLGVVVISRIPPAHELIFAPPVITMSTPGYPRVYSRASRRVTDNVIRWGTEVEVEVDSEDEPPSERSVSPVPSVSEISAASVYASMGQPEEPEGTGAYKENAMDTWDGEINGTGAVGGYVHVVGNQGAVRY
ncbi:hypothetical protein BU17DRAFT_98130 [Hysterangium stoloniferum]|nr:hypothetical protein BU17DRAFT_98130 [Hysterangium stoloniferum]